jgi:hypothetical protein
MAGYRDTAGDMYKAAILGLDGTKALNGDPATLAAIDAAHRGEFNMGGGLATLANGDIVATPGVDDDAQRVWNSMASQYGKFGVSKGTAGSPPVLFYNEGPGEWMGAPGYNQQPAGWGPTGWNQTMATPIDALPPGYVMNPATGQPEPMAPSSGYGAPGTVVSNNGEIATIPGSGNASPSQKQPTAGPPTGGSGPINPGPAGPNENPAGRLVPGQMPAGGVATTGYIPTTQNPGYGTPQTPDVNGSMVPYNSSDFPRRTGNGEITTIPGSNPTLPPPVTPPPAGVNLGGPRFPTSGDISGMLPPPLDANAAQSALAGLTFGGVSPMTATALDTSSAPSIQRESGGLQGLMSDSPYGQPLPAQMSQGAANRRMTNAGRRPETIKNGLAGLQGIG